MPRGIYDRTNRTIAPEVRFWAKVNKTATCWLWTGHLNQGYGWFAWPDKSLSNRVHRAAWVLSGRSIPPGLELDHLCRVRNCINPDHLEVVTTAENLRRAHPSLHAAARGIFPCGHPRSGYNVIPSYGEGYYERCRQCTREAERRRRRLKRADSQDSASRC